MDTRIFVMRHTLILILLCSALLLALAPLAQAQTTPCAGSVHTVATGETLFAIAQRYGTTVNALAAANGLANPNQIFITQQLCIPGGNLGTGGPAGQTPPTTTTTTTTTPSSGNSATVGGPVFVNTNRYVVNRAAGSVEVTVPAGTVDSLTGATTTATIGLDATNSLLHVQSGGMIPNSWVSIYISSELGDIAGRAGVLRTDGAGAVDGYVQIPRLAGVDRHYVMVRAYDNRMTFGYFNLNPLTRFP